MSNLEKPAEAETVRKEDRAQLVLAHPEMDLVAARRRNLQSWVLAVPIVQRLSLLLIILHHLI